MTGKERMLRAFEGEPIDAVPVAPLYLGIYLRRRSMKLYFDKCWQLTASGPWKVTYDWWVEFQLAFHRELYSVFREAHDWIAVPGGGRRRDVEGSMIVREGGRLFWQSPNGSRSEIHKYEQPFTSGQDREVVLTARDDVRKLCGPPPQVDRLLEDDYALVPQRFCKEATQLTALAMGTAFWHTYATLGFTGMMRTMVEEPALFERLVGALLENQVAHIPFWKAFGADAMFVEECLSSNDLISEKQYVRFCFPYTRELLAELKRAGFRVVFYICGDVTGRLRHLAELPCDALGFEESKKGFEIDIGGIRKEIGGKVCLFGNADVKLIESGADADICREVERQVKAAGPRRYVLSVGSPPTPDTLPAKLDVFTRAGHAVRVE